MELKNGDNLCRLVFARALKEVASSENFEELYGEACVDLCSDQVASVKIEIAVLARLLFGREISHRMIRILKDDPDDDVQFEVQRRYRKQRGLKVLSAGLHQCGLTPVNCGNEHDFDDEMVFNLILDDDQKLEKLRPCDDESLFTVSMEDILL